MHAGLTSMHERKCSPYPKMKTKSTISLRDMRINKNTPEIPSNMKTCRTEDFENGLDESNMPSWERLYRMGTASKLLKTLDYERFNSGTPTDSLDIALNASYNHEKDFSLSKAEILKQMKTREGSLKWLVLGESADTSYAKPGKRYDKTLNAETPHEKASAQGFSRKLDGAFYKVTSSRIEQY